MHPGRIISRLIARLPFALCKSYDELGLSDQDRKEARKIERTWARFMLSLGFGLMVIFAFNMIEPYCGGQTFQDPRTGETFYANFSGLLFWAFCVSYCGILVLIYLPHERRKRAVAPTVKDNLQQLS